MIVHGYIRVSTDEQADSRLGLEAQRASVSEACVRRGYDLAGFFEDAGLSGGSTRRPALQELLGTVRAGEGIVVAKLDRLSRSVHDFAGLVKVARREGWSPIVLDPDLDLATPNGRLVANIIVSVAEWEADIIGQRTREALQAKVARGERVGGTPLITGGLAEEIRELRAGGLTLREICADLEARGVPTPRGGLVWRPSSLQGVLARC
jgi:DNA invertase Pin-like site-specific DNA recombinase